MTPVVAVIAPGAMGAAVGKRLVDNGVTVLTSLEGRSEETHARAKSAGMRAAKDDDIARAEGGQQGTMQSRGGISFPPFGPGARPGRGRGERHRPVAEWRE